MDTLLEDVDDARPIAELNCCIHFLFDSELEKVAMVFLMMQWNTMHLLPQQEFGLDVHLSWMGRQSQPCIRILFWEVLKLERVETFWAHKSNTVLERSKHVYTEKKTSTRKRVCRKTWLLIVAIEKQRTQKRNIPNLRLLQTLLRYLMVYPWVLKMQYYLNPFDKPQYDLSYFRDKYKITLLWQPLFP